MINRYTREEMGSIWSEWNRLDQMLLIEKTVAMVQGQKKIIPLQASRAIEKKAKFSLPIIRRLESKTKHDVSAFVKNASSYVGQPWGAYFHYGLTSSDVLDTALSLQMKQSAKIISRQISSVKKILKKLIRKNRATLCLGRTHGIHAEPTTFGFKLLNFLSELSRAENTFTQAVKEGAVGMVSGPVGNYSVLSQELEKSICRHLGLSAEPISTQVVPRDRHARVIFALSLILSALERWSVELRHLQRTEVSEVCEGFSKGQQGSSSMPHKKNPISSENITGLSRLLKSYLQSSLENIILWHERDISHSSVERVIFPDAFILCDYSLFRMKDILENLVIHKEKMKKNLMSSDGVVFSSQILLILVKKGVSRQAAYSWIQKAAHADHLNFKEALKNTPAHQYISEKEWQDIFSGKSCSNRISNLVLKKLKLF